MVIRDTGSLPGRIETGPDAIDFGVSPPHGSADATFTIIHAQSDARLSASIVADNSQGRFRIQSLKSYEETTEKDSTDGTRPLNVSRGQKIEIALRFYSLLPKGQDYFEAVLMIQDVSANRPWKPIHAGMTALVGGITTILPPAVQIQQGQRLSVPITVISNAGPDTTVSFIMRSRPNWISMTPLQVSLPRGKRVTATLALAAAPTALLGTQDAIIESAAFDGKLLIPHKLPVIARVIAVPLPDLPQPQPADVCGYLEGLSGLPSQDNQTWSNWGIVDSPETVLGFLPTAKLFQPTNPYEIANAVQQAEAAGKTICARGSGWSFSDAVLPQPAPIADVQTFGFRAQGISGQLEQDALSGQSPVFSSFFGFSIDTSKLDRSLQTLLPNILVDNRGIESLFFAEAGMTIISLNTLLDNQTPAVALKTMGGAAAQTIAGAISTGTHGGDFDRAPLADSVRAIYLVGKGGGLGVNGTHHWIEPLSRRITDRVKIHATFPCIHDTNIHYDDDMFRAALVSMGAMGVIYAVILDVVPQYSLLQVNKWSTWEDLKEEQSTARFAGLFNGSWSGLTGILRQLGIENHSPNRFAQVVINPMRRTTDGKHNCYVSNRVELPLQARSGVTPLTDFRQVAGQVRSAIENSPEYGFFEHAHFCVGFIHGELGTDEDPVHVRMRKLLTFCKGRNYPWAIRAVIDMIMTQYFPRSSNDFTPDSRRRPPTDRSQPEPVEPHEDAPSPQIDIGFKVMAPGDTSRAFPTLGGTSVESAFSFFSRSDHPGADVITFIDAVLAEIDQGVERDRVFPGGWLSLRVTGQTNALLGMERFDCNGLVELSLIGNPDDYAVVRRVEKLTLEMGGALHWGQSNGLMTFRDVEAAYRPAAVATWRTTQLQLGGSTFTNFFMRRCGLAPTPSLRLDPTSIHFDTTPVGETKNRMFRIANIGSGPLQVSLSRSPSGPFLWAGFSTVIPPGGFEDADVEFAPRSPGRHTGTLLLESNAPESPHRVALTGVA